MFGMIKRTKVTVGGRVYEVLKFPGSLKKLVNLDVMVRRAKEKKAVITKDDLTYLFAHRNDFPGSFTRIFALVVDSPSNDTSFDLRAFQWSSVEGWGNAGLDPNFDTNGSYEFIRRKS